MIKSPNDSKNYRPLTLTNGLRVLLVSNYDSQKAAAALAVNAGHFNDPKDRQGMAHFLEHMLFLGTEKYPDGSEYQKFISQYGGHNNAWTATEHTCYFFDIHQQHFNQALDRFSQFFIAPLLSEEFVQKERKNIDAEFKLKLKDDIRRLYDVHKETINPKHPFSQFSVGNQDTLADRATSCLREEVVAFFQRYYCANYMTLALEAPLALDELEILAQKYFSAIKSSQLKLPQISEPLYRLEHQKVLIQIMPVKKERQLIISFALPSIDHLYRHKPESLLAYLIGHEGPGSLLSLLKQRQWAMRLTAGSGINGSNFKDFNINISLTEHGEQHINDITSLLFSYLTLLKQQQIPKYFYQEKQAIAKLSFDFQEKQKPLDTVSQLVVNMQHYPEQDYIFGDYVMDDFCQNHIDKLLAYFTTNNMRLIHISQNNDFDQVSHWYQVPYKVTNIAEDLLAHWQQAQPTSELYLPAPNPYIVSEPKVLASEQIELLPKQLSNQENISCWFKQDHTFKVPKGHIYLGIDTPAAIASPTNIVMTRLFVELFNDNVVEQNYAAELAGIHYHLYSHQGGMTLQLSGVSTRQAQLLEELLASLKQCSYQLERFELFKQQLINQWHNTDKSKSIAQLFAHLSSSMQPKNPSADTLLSAMQDINFEQFCQFSQHLLDDIYIEMLIHGNWQQADANAILTTISEKLGSKSNIANKVKVPVIKIKDQGQLTLPLLLPEHDHATVLYYPQADRDLQTTAKTMITSHLLSPLFFQEMRTEKQYGYLVGVGYIPLNRYPGIAFYIQSPHIDALALTLAIDDFITHCLAEVKAMPSAEWQQLQQGLAGQLQEKDTSLRVKSQRFWASISHQDFTFDHKQKLIEALFAITPNDIIDFINNKLITQSNPDRLNLISIKSDNINNTDMPGKILTKQQSVLTLCEQMY